MRESVFFRQVSLLATGSLIAQIIVVSFSPIITRIFSPDALGVAAVFISITGPLAVFVTTYPIAIVLPKNESHAFRLITLSLSIAIIFTAILSLALIILGQRISVLINIREIDPYIYLIPVAIIGCALSAVTSQWLIRRQLFLLISKIAVITAIVTSVIKVTLGYLYPEPSVLIYTSLLGLFLSTLILIYHSPKDFSRLIHNKIFSKYFIKMYLTARKYKDFLLYRSPQNLLNVLNHSIPIFLLTTLFGVSSSGYYSLSFAVLSVPTTLISGSVYQAIYPKISTLYNDGVDITPLLIKSILWLAIVGLIPMITMMIVGQDIFSFVFGDLWGKSGIYAQWMSIALFFYYICRPVIAAIPVLGVQRELLIWEVYDLVSKASTLYLAYIYSGNDVVVVGALSIISAINTFGLILYVLIKSNHYSTEREK